MQLIDKDKLIETIQQIPCWECDGHGIDECYSCIIERVVDAPAVDAVEVVRCKDCSKRNSPFCMAFELKDGPQDDDYCSLGEKLDMD